MNYIRPISDAFEPAEGSIMIYWPAIRTAPKKRKVKHAKVTRYPRRHKITLR